MSKLASTRNIAFEGGGMLGIAYIPVIRMLEEHGVSRELTGFAGTSAGAITASLMALGSTPGHMEFVLRHTDWAQFPGRELHTVKLIRMVRHLGWNSLEYPRAWLRRQVKTLGWPEDVTFRQLYEQTGRQLYVPATHEDEGRAVVFSAARTPDLSIATAVLASMAIPLYWPPVEIGGERYSDGGLTMNHPMDVFTAAQVETVIGLRLDSTREVRGEARRVRGIVGRALRLAQIARQAANEAHIPSCFWDNGRVIVVDTGDLKATEFSMDDAKVAELLRRGEKAVREWLAK